MNRQVGFQNFADYEGRKDLAWEGAYRWEASRMALNAPLQTEPVRSLEARLSPTAAREDLIRKVLRFDQGKRFADQPFRPLPPEDSYFDPEQSATLFLREPHFYVLHFPKRCDDSLPSSDFSQRYRHQALREEVRVKAEPWTDAPLLPHPTHRLSVTYHAGEDFYDIADGLRAIDEALRFLDYRRGDRIGHALALGVDPQIHYQTKSMNIVLPKQNRLDNLVWLLYRGRELGARIDPQLYGTLQQEALRLLQDIYGYAAAQNNWSVTLQDYFCSMMIRGDEPSLYRSTRFQGPDRLFGRRYDDYQIPHGQSDLELSPYRKSPKIAGLYYYYHYGWRENQEGRKPSHVQIKQDYIALVRQVQNALQRHLAARGILIECNPSSNVLIGTFGGYGRHPIIRFNQMGLATLPDPQCPQLHVCVNTDDLGVFDTSLEFEYTLLYRALCEQIDEEGAPLYTEKGILRYLKNIRDMGIQAVFPAAKQAERFFRAGQRSSGR